MTQNLSIVVWFLRSNYNYFKIHIQIQVCILIIYVCCVFTISHESQSDNVTLVMILLKKRIHIGIIIFILCTTFDIAQGGKVRIEKKRASNKIQKWQFKPNMLVTDIDGQLMEARGISKQRVTVQRIFRGMPFGKAFSMDLGDLMPFPWSDMAKSDVDDFDRIWKYGGLRFHSEWLRYEFRVLLVPLFISGFLMNYCQDFAWMHLAFGPVSGALFTFLAHKFCDVWKMMQQHELTDNGWIYGCLFEYFLYICFDAIYDLMFL